MLKRSEALHKNSLFHYELMRKKTPSNAMAPAIAGYRLFQKTGRHGSVKDRKAVGSRCTNAVASRTPEEVSTA